VYPPEAQDLKEAEKLMICAVAKLREAQDLVDAYHWTIGFDDFTPAINTINDMRRRLDTKTPQHPRT
jgi:hypothetical protein